MDDPRSITLKLTLFAKKGRKYRSEECFFYITSKGISIALRWRTSIFLFANTIIFWSRDIKNNDPGIDYDFRWLAWEEGQSLFPADQPSSSNSILGLQPPKSNYKYKSALMIPRLRDRVISSESTLKRVGPWKDAKSFLQGWNKHAA